MNNLFKILGDENRLRIINLLRKEKLCVCEIETILNTTQSNASRHLTKLKNENIVDFEKKSQWIYYKINPKFIENNKLLYQYLEEKMIESDKFKSDIKKLLEYKKNGVSCESLEKLKSVTLKK